LEAGQQEQSVHQEFLEIDFNSTNNVLICQTGKFSELSAKKARLLGGTISTWLKKHRINNICLPNDDEDIFSKTKHFRPFFEGLFLGGYSFYKQNDHKNWSITVHLPKKYSDKNEELINIQKYALAMDIARTLGNEPANVINPVSLAETCRQLGAQYGFTVKIMDEKDLTNLGAGGVLSVGQGSVNKSRLIVLEHNGLQENENPIVLVGKAITFDTGGYSLKSVEGIQGMKYDKLGGITVIGFMVAAALLKLPQRIVGIIAAAENMVSDFAYRPDDIIKTLSGKTVEIITTDAEGRLVLADGLTYAQNNYLPKYIIDFATLTGGIVTALGNVRAGLFSNNDELAQKLFTAGENSSEKLWRLPLDDEYFEFIKGDFADLKNSGGRKGHPIMGAIFLKQFIQNNTPWAHIDIAGTSKNDKSDGLNPIGANGFGIRLMLEFIKNL
jgi:leucyl aminopeptidase